MRAVVYTPVCFVALLIICLMFAPARYVTGHRTIYPMPAPLAESTPLPASDRPFADLCRDDPVGALARSLHRYKTEVEGYTCIFIKQERIGDKLRQREVIDCEFRESPFAVHMHWREGKGRALAMLYPAGDRTDRLAVVPANEIARKLVPYATRGLDDREVRAQSRYPVTEFGLQHGTARAHAAMQAAKTKGTLKTRYDGIQAIPELDGKQCHVLHRDSDIPEEDGQTHLMLCFDVDTLLQVGSVVHAGDELVATYYFKDIVINPMFKPGHFGVERLK